MSRYKRPATENMVDLLTCPICMERYDNIDHQPKLLPCHHTFCNTCLVSMTSSQSKIQCPTCREKTHVLSPPPLGVSRLQTNFYVTQMKEFVEQDTDCVVKNKGCRKHVNKPLVYYCKTCEVPICATCCTSDHKTSTGHETQDIETAINDQKAALQLEIRSAQQNILSNATVITKYETEIGNLYAAKEKAVRNIDSTFDRYVELLNQRRQELKEELLDIYTQTKGGLSYGMEDLKKQDASLLGLIEQCDEAMSAVNIHDLLAYKAKLESRNREVNSEGTQMLAENNFVKFNVGNNEHHFWGLTSNLGEITANDPLPCKVKVTDCVPIASLFTTFELHVEDRQRQELENYPISVEIVDRYDDTIPNIIQYRSAGIYEVTFRPQVSGVHRLKVKFLGLEMKHGAVNLEVQSNDPVAKLGVRGQGEAEMDYPRAVAVDSMNNIYVMDTGNNRVQRFDRMRRFISEFSISDEAESYSSCGLAVNESQQTIICPEVCVQDADLSEANCILVYTMDGTQIQRFIYRDIMRRALSVAVNSALHMVIADYEMNVIFVFDRHGRLLHKFGETGSGPGQFNKPTFVCTGENDIIIVSDGDNNRIQVFDKHGKFLYQFGRKGTGKGQFSLPFGVAADNHGNILVVDGGNRRVQIFKAGGEFLCCIESAGDPMNAPRGVAITMDGHVLVADRDNHCVKKYKYLHCTTL